MSKANQKKSIGHAIQYDILTKLTLFKKYLLRSENLVVKLASDISNIEIGESVIVIPAILFEFIDKSKPTHSIPSPSPSKAIGTFPIKSAVFDAQQKVIGEISLVFEMIAYDRVFHELDMEKLSTQNIMAAIDDDVLTNEATKRRLNGNGNENNMNQYNLDLKNIELNKVCNEQKKWTRREIDQNKKSFLRQERMPLSAAATKRISIKSRNISSPLLNYLTGRPLHAAEETEAVRAMASTSPTESLIDQLSYDLNGLYLTKKPTTTTESIESNVLKKIDCMRIHVDNLCLSRAGVREILSKASSSNGMSFGSGTFTVSIDFDSILSISKSPFEMSNTTFSSKVTRIFDTSIETNPPGECSIHIHTQDPIQS